MLICNWCGEIFDEPEWVSWLEQHPELDDRTPEPYAEPRCPYCGDYDIEEYTEE